MQCTKQIKSTLYASENNNLFDDDKFRSYTSLFYIPRIYFKFLSATGYIQTSETTLNSEISFVSDVVDFACKYSF